MDEAFMRHRESEYWSFDSWLETCEEVRDKILLPLLREAYIAGGDGPKKAMEGLQVVHEKALKELRKLKAGGINISDIYKLMPAGSNVALGYGETAQDTTPTTARTFEEKIAMLGQGESVWYALDEEEPIWTLFDRNSRASILYDEDHIFTTEDRRTLKNVVNYLLDHGEFYKSCIELPTGVNGDEIEIQLQKCLEGDK